METWELGDYELLELGYLGAWKLVSFGIRKLGNQRGKKLGNWGT